MDLICILGVEQIYDQVRRNVQQKQLHNILGLLWFLQARGHQCHLLFRRKFEHQRNMMRGGGKKGRYVPCFKGKQHTRYLRRPLTSEQSVVCRQDVWQRAADNSTIYFRWFIYVFPTLSSSSHLSFAQNLLLTVKQSTFKKFACVSSV